MSIFALKLAWRETRTSWKHFVYFFICIALGVGAVVGLGLFAANIEQTITRDARALLGGDLEIRLTHRLGDPGQAVLDSLRGRDILVSHVSELVAMSATAHRDDRGVSDRSTQLVELKAVDPAYPLYGSVTTQPQTPLSALLHPIEDPFCPNRCFGAVVQPALLIRLGLELGSPLKIGQAVFIIRGTLEQEPDRVAGAFSLGPRVLISRQGLAATDLVRPGSRIRERYLLRLPSDVPLKGMAHEMRGRLADEGARVVTYQDAQPRIRRFLEQLAQYLGLIGLAALFIGGIGIASTIQAFLKEKVLTLAILKTLGAESRVLLASYLGQALFLGVIGSGLGIVVGLVLLALLPELLSGMLDLSMTRQLFALPLIKGVVLGMLTTLLFALWPLLGIRHVPPALVFRREVTPHPDRDESGGATWFSRMRRRLSADPPRYATALGITAGLAALAMWQARSVTLGLLFVGGLAVAIGMLALGALGLIRLVGVFPFGRSFAVRHACTNLRRPDGQVSSILVAIGVGVMVVVTVSLVEGALLRALGERIPTDAPSFFFIDIQPDQATPFRHLVSERTSAPPELLPVVRSRLSAIDGRDVDPNRYQNRRDGWYFTREYVLTYREDLPEGNAIVEGGWWNGAADKDEAGGTGGRVSVEADAARHLGLEVGSTVTFDIQGTPIRAHVTSLRSVDWSSFSPNFYMILEPGSLTGAPVTYIAAVRVPSSMEVPLQQAVVRHFPNVTAIKVGDVLANVVRMLKRLVFAIQGIAAFCIVTGAIVLAGALAATRYRRIRESAILKAFGATRRILTLSFATEYLLLGAMAGVIGIGLAVLLSWAVTTFVLDIGWAFLPRILTVALACTMLLVLVVGTLGTFRILGRPPLAVLREE